MLGNSRGYRWFYLRSVKSYAMIIRHSTKQYRENLPVWKGLCSACINKNIFFFMYFGPLSKQDATLK